MSGIKKIAHSSYQKLLNQKEQILKTLCKYAQDDFHVFCQIFSKDWDKKADFNFKTYKMSCKVLQAFVEGRLYKSAESTKPIEFLFFNACPSWGKSYLITRLLTLWLFSTRIKLEAFIVTANEQNRKKIMGDISLMLKEKTFNKIFNQFLDRSFLVKNNDSEKVTISKNWLNMKPARSDITGSRGNFFVFDDFDKPTHVGRKEFETSKQFLDMYLTRGHKNQLNFAIMNQQRVDVNDSTGYLMEIFDAGNFDYQQIKVPYKFTEDTEYNFYIKNKHNDVIEKHSYQFSQNTFSSPGFTEEKYNSDVLVRECQSKVEKRETQYQQNPTNSESQLITSDCFQYYNTYDLYDVKIIDLFFTSDLAFTTKKTSDYSVLFICGISSDHKLYILDIARGKYQYPDFENIIVNKYQEFNKITTSQGKGSIKVGSLYLEDNSVAYGDLLTRRGVVVEMVSRAGQGSAVRLNQALRYIKDKLVYLPVDHKHTQDVITECINFREDLSHKHDDIVDCLTDAINLKLAKYKEGNVGSFAYFDY